MNLINKETVNEIVKKMMNYKRVVIIVSIVIFSGLDFSRASNESESISISVKKELTIEQLRQMRHKMAQKKRRIIFNNDGCDAYKYPENKHPTAKGLISIRTPAVDSHVDTISYCTLTSSFGMFLHRTQVGEFISDDHPTRGVNLARLLVQQGTDPLQVRVDWARKNNKEIFWSMRMNDVHDYGHTPEKPYYRWSKLKTDHPEYMFAPSKKRLPQGRWSAIDYTYSEIRNLAFRYFEEVCQNYDIDGIELDFFRHLYLFKNVAYGKNASQQELNMMTGLIQRIRTMTESEGLKRGRPILISVRVPDSLGYCKGVGIDLDRWLSEGLVDMVIGSGYFRLNPWQYLVEIGSKYNVQIYAGLSEPRIAGQGRLKRQQKLDYRARAMDAWQAGVDGIYIFNEYNATKTYLSEIGESTSLDMLNKLYFATYLDGNVSHYLSGGENYRNLPCVTPKHPAVMMAGESIEISIWVGDDFAKTMALGHTPQITCKVWTPNYDTKHKLTIQFNQQPILNFRYEKNYLIFTVSPEHVCRGKNTVRFDLSDKSNAKIVVTPEKWALYRRFNDKKILKWPHEKPFWRWPKPNDSISIKIRNKSLYLADNGSEAGDMAMILNPWHINPNGKTVIETRLKVDSSTDPMAVAVRFADGHHVEYLTLSEKKIGLRFADLSYAMDTTDDFHLYRIEIKEKNLRVYVDGKLKIDAAGEFVKPVADKDGLINMKLPYYLTTANKSGVALGSFSDSGKSSSWCKFIRYKSDMLSIKDMALEIIYE